MIDFGKIPIRHVFGRRACFVAGSVLLFLSICPSLIGQTRANSSKTEDIRDIMVQRPPDHSVFLWISLFILLAGIVLGALIFSIKCALDSSSPLGPPPETVALKRLARIRQQMNDLLPNKASLEASEAVKDFLATRYQDPIRYETAEEYLTRLGATPQGANTSADSHLKLSAKVTEDVRTFMSISQELKFAKLREAREKVPALLAQAENIVEMASKES